MLLARVGLPADLGPGYCEIGPSTAWAFRPAGLRPGPLRRGSAVRYLWRVPATAVAVRLLAFFLSTTFCVREIDVLHILSAVVEALEDLEPDEVDDFVVVLLLMSGGLVVVLGDLDDTPERLMASGPGIDYTKVAVDHHYSR
jgi:hypothetical protein